MFVRFTRVLLIVGLLVSISLAKKAPDFTFKSLDGKEVSLSDYKGKVVLVNFWATWCGPCIGEMPDLNKLYQAYKDKGFQILGLAVSSRPNDIPKKVKQTGVTYPILLNAEPAVAKFGGFGAIPQTFIIDQNGTIVHSVTGSRGYEDFEKMIKPLLTAAK
ncbi:MAG: TlpA family protein disulfide reductase [Calditrichaeota bacterium]|nr:MAG: TlpA family protein disulfide reductase [Calditrichota bacterium]